ncbi:hypothetical protein EBZ80_16825 [bacterium]|nr:hypothetical protein [bacterium]
MNVGDLVRFWTPAVPKGLQHNGIIIDVTHENVGGLKMGSVYHVLTSRGQIVTMTVGGLELVSPVQDDSSVV